MIRRQLLAAVRAMLVLTIVFGVGYPLAVTAVAQVTMRHAADGGLVTGPDGTVVGSSLIGQSFTDPQWFHPRPDAFDPRASAAANLGPTNPELATQIRKAATAYRAENGLATDATIPADAVTTSASGLDPDITLANALLQVPRVARARGMSPAAVVAIVHEVAQGRQLGFLGEPTVNVLALNLALDTTAG